MSLAPRNRFFGLKGPCTRLTAKALNRWLVVLSRVVLHPTYRGAGIATAFVRRSCELCPEPWIETLAEMGHLNPFFERAGFIRAGEVSGRRLDRRRHSDIWGRDNRAPGVKHRRRRSLLSSVAHRKSYYSTPLYYVFDNRFKEPQEGKFALVN